MKTFTVFALLLVLTATNVLGVGKTSKPPMRHYIGIDMVSASRQITGGNSTWNKFNRDMGIQLGYATHEDFRWQLWVNWFDRSFSNSSLNYIGDVRINGTQVKLGAVMTANKGHGLIHPYLALNGGYTYNMINYEVKVYEPTFGTSKQFNYSERLDVYNIEGLFGIRITPLRFVEVSLAGSVGRRFGKNPLNDVAPEYPMFGYTSQKWYVGGQAGIGIRF